MKRRLLNRLACAAALALLPVGHALAKGAGVLLVGNKGENSVSFVDLGSGKELGRAVTGDMPHEIAISPDGRQAAVVAYGGRSVDIFDVASRSRLKTIDLLPNRGPHGIVWLKNGRLVITTERSRSLTIADPDKGIVTATIKTDQDGTHMVAVSRTGGLAYTANIASGTVSVIDLTAQRKLRDIPVGGKPEGIALSNDDRILWIADLDAPRVQAFDARTFRKLGEVVTGKTPIRVAASPDGRWIVTSNLGSGSLTMIDAKTRRRVREIMVSGRAEAGQVTILFARNGRRLYAAETGRDTVAEIDLESGKILRRLPAGKNGDGLAIAGK